MAKGATDSLTIEGRVIRFKYIFPILSTITFGLYAFMCRMYPSIRIFIETKKSSIMEATHIKVIKHDNNNEMCLVNKFFFPFISMRLKRYIQAKQIRFFETQCTRFFYDIKTNKYVPIDKSQNMKYDTVLCNHPNDDVNKKIAARYYKEKIDKTRYKYDDLYRKYFFSDIKLLEKYILYSSNDTELKPKSLRHILTDIIFSPLFLYNMLGIAIWMMISYYIYATIILLITLHSLVTDFRSELKKNKNLQELSKTRREITAYRNNEWIRLDVKELFPGDIFCIEHEKDFPCDAEIIKGEVIVDESFLTGETVPVFKGADINDRIVYAGTNILKTMGEDFYFENQQNDPINAQVKVRLIKRRPLRSELKRNSPGSFSKYEEGEDILDTNEAENEEEAKQDYSKSNDIAGINIQENEDLIVNPDNNLVVEETDNLNDEQFKNNDNYTDNAFKDFNTHNVRSCENIQHVTLSANNNRVNDEVKQTNNSYKSNIEKPNNQDNDQTDSLKKYDEKEHDETLQKGKNVLFSKLIINDKSNENFPDFSYNNVKKQSGKAVCRAISTKFDTAKGRLIKNIMMPKKDNFIFRKQSEKVICFLFFFGLFMSFLMFIYLKYSKFSTYTSATFCIDLIFCIVSPALPATISIGSTMIVKRLMEKKIVSNEPSKINLIGKTDLLIFDKTGTLTEDGLDLYCIDDLDNEYMSFEGLEKKENIWVGLSVCHSVYEIDNQLVGDPLDIKMFLFSKGEIFNHENKRFIHLGSNPIFKGPLLKQGTEDENSIHYYHKISVNRKYHKSLEVIKSYEFDNKLRRMSVIIKDENQNIFLYVKGAPESIYELLDDPDEDYLDTVNDHSLDGFRILAMGYKQIHDFNMHYDRTTHEKNLKFLCFIVFANKLKPETKPTLESLHNAKIKTIMATGDNILTAISVARQAKLIDKFTPVIFPILKDTSKSFFNADWLCIGDEEYIFDKIKLTLHRREDRNAHEEFYVACEGREYDAIRNENNEFYRFLMHRGVIFARMNPDQKKLLVEDFCNIGKTTLFCGDGANDCGALRSADIGLALAENEASLASSFTSTIKNISSVLTLLKEGRCALTTSFSRFQFLLLTCFIQYVSLIGLMYKFKFLSETQTKHHDFLLILPIAFIMTKFKSNQTLDASLPDYNLFTKIEIIRILGHLIINTSFILFCIVFLYFFNPEEVIQGDFQTKTLASSITFFLSSCQIIVMGVLFMKGRPHRESRKQKKSFIFTFIVLIILLLFSFINQYFKFFDRISDWYEFVNMNNHEFLVTLIYCLSNVLVSFLFEHFVKKYENSLSDCSDDI